MNRLRMNSIDDTIRNSPVGFEEAVAYALHPEMRRLIILYIVGTLLVPTGIAWMIDPPISIFGVILGVGLVIVGAVFLFGGLVGTLFKLVTDANRVAIER